MRPQSVFVKVTASVSVFFVLAYCFHHYSQALRVAIHQLSMEVDLLSRNEYTAYASRPYIYDLGRLVWSALILAPAILSAIYTYLCLSVGHVRFSLRNLFFATTAVAMFLIFGREVDHFYFTETATEGYLVAAGYGSLVLLVTWVLVDGIRNFEKIHRIESAEKASTANQVDDSH